MMLLFSTVQNCVVKIYTNYISVSAFIISIKLSIIYFSAQCESEVFGNKWLLGDSAYPLKPYLLPPLLHPQTLGEILYNEAHIRTRNCIERYLPIYFV